AGGLAERVEVAPLVGCVERITLVCSVGGVDLDGALPGQEGPECLIDERGVGEPRARSPRLGEQLRVNGRAHSHTRHAITIPPICHSTAWARTDSDLRRTGRRIPKSI